MNDHLIQFQREKTGLKYFLIGRKYDVALKALGFAERYHVGLRKDGKTPEFHHQVQIALSATQLPQLINEEVVITAILLHDVQEDHHITSEEIEANFGHLISDVVWRLTKKFKGQHKNNEDYINEAAMCPHSSICKGLDRLNNLQSMLGVFGIEKMTQYLDESEKLFLPMLKKAEKLFPEQQVSYQVITQQMKQIIKFARSYVEVSQKVSDQDHADVGSLEYKGNSVSYIHSKMTAYKSTIEQAWDALRALGRHPDGNTSLTDAIKLLGTDLRESCCDHKKKIELFNSALKVIAEDSQISPAHALQLREALRKEMGISELSLLEFYTHLE